MKFTLSWLKDYLETKASLKQIVETLTKIGLEVENVDDRSLFRPFCISRILKAGKHPHADKLQVLVVDTGSKNLVQVVCGAPNARVGLVSVFAPPGTWIPGTKTKLTIREIRGIKSFGMMCSERELLLSDEQTRILELSTDAPIGTPFSVYAKLDDPIISINLTPDRADCASVYGIARDLAATGIGYLKAKKTIPVISDKQCEIKVFLPEHEQRFLDNLDKKKELVPCHGFAWREIRTLQNGISPDWLQRRLIAIGHKPINTIVDIINYLTFDLGYPLQVFNADKIGKYLVVRRGKNRENFSALDGKSYTLASDYYVIADEEAVVSLPGIMGGKETQCDSNTSNILIKSALWNPHFVIRMGRDYGISSDARYRFERGVDPNFMLSSLEMATRMIIDLCGGVASRRKLCGLVFYPPKKIFFHFSEVERLTGIVLFSEKICNIFDRLGFKLENRKQSGVTVAIPTWRYDLDQEADLVKEIIRIHGVNNITPQPLLLPFKRNGEVLSTLQIRTRSARHTLACRGMLEAVTWSFVSERIALLFSDDAFNLRLINPISIEMSNMRPSLLPGLLEAARRNGDRGFEDLAIFEVSDVYKGLLPEKQFRVAAGIRCNTAKFEGSGRFWSGNSSFVTVFDAKADALSVLECCGMITEKIQAERKAPSWYHPGRSGSLKLELGKNILGYFGELHPEILEKLKLKGSLCGFEIFLDEIPQKKKECTRRVPLVLSQLQKVKRDFSFIVDKAVTAASVIRAAFSADRTKIQSVRIFDLFEKNVSDLHKKSIGIEVLIQPKAQTMTYKELGIIEKKIIESVLKVTKGTLRC